MTVSGRAFDVLKRLSVDGASSLSAAAAAFRPNVMDDSLDLEVELRRVRLLHPLPAGAFTSSKSIVIQDSVVRGVSAGAFSGSMVGEVVFRGCSIDRLHRGAFPDKLYVERLTLDNCTVTSVSERAVESGISALTVSNCRINSISREAVRNQVAKVRVEGNAFKTLKTRAFAVRSWDTFVVSANRIDFMDSDCLSGVSGPSEGARFAFTDNLVSHANRDALRLNLTEGDALEGVDLARNSFREGCACGKDRWLAIVCGALSQDQGSVDVVGMVRNGSSCELKPSVRKCFGGNETATFLDYHNKMCSEEALASLGENNKQRCSEPTRLEEVWETVQEQVDIDTNKGILTVLLVAAVFFSLVVSICTLLRWIAFVLRTRSLRAKNEDEWNFTKIEEKRFVVDAEDEDEGLGGQASPSLADHYESLPLTKEEEEDEDEDEDVLEEGGSTQTTRSDVEKTPDSSCGSKEKPAKAGGSKRESCVSSPRSRPESKISSEEEQQVKTKKEEGIGEPPKMTFYDEMIDLLKEKLEDPDNYATVADNSSASAAAGAAAAPSRQQELYQDPFSIGQSSSSGVGKKLDKK